MKSFVIFGPTHSGKSTLAGHLLTHGCSEQDFQAREKANMKMLKKEGQPYYADMRLSYFVDTAKDEHRKFIDPEESSPGTTKQIHIKMMQDGRFQMIDVPGSDRNRKVTIRGIAMADIGFCVIDATETYTLASMLDRSDQYDTLYHRIFDPMFYWLNVKKNALNTLFVILSKIDLLSYNPLVIEDAINFVRSVSPFSNIPVCPVSIDVNTRASYHIFEDSLCAGWYIGQPRLVEYLNRDIARDSQNDAPFYACIEMKRRPQYLGNNVVRVRVLRGKIAEGDSIVLGPVKTEKDDAPVFLDGKVKSVRIQDGVEKVKCLDTGCIGGVAFESLLLNKGRRNYDLESIKLTRLSMLFSPEQVVKGNLLTVQLNPHLDIHSKLLEITKLKSDIQLIWFGKLVNVTILAMEQQEGKRFFTLYKKQESESDLFVVPLDSSKGESPFLYNRFALQFASRDTMPVTLTDVSILNRRTPCTISLEYLNELGLDEDEIKSILTLEDIAGFNFERRPLLLVDYSPVTSQNTLKVLEKIRTLLDTFYISRSYKVTLTRNNL